MYHFWASTGLPIVKWCPVFEHHGTKIKILKQAGCLSRFKVETFFLFVSTKLQVDKSYKSVPVSSSNEVRRPSLDLDYSDIDIAPMCPNRCGSCCKRNKSIEKCCRMFSSFASSEMFSTTDVKDITTVNNFDIKKEPSYLKDGSPCFAWGHVNSPVPPRPVAVQKSCLVTLGSLLCGKESLLSDAPISPSDINTIS